MLEELYRLYSEDLVPVERETFYRVLRPEEAKVFYETQEERVVGACVVHGNSVSLLCVERAWRNRGIGGRLLGQAEEYLLSQGAQEILLGRGPHYLLQGVPEGEAVAFFQKRGYAATWSSVDMSLPLKGDALRLPQTPEGLAFRYAGEGDQSSLLQAVEDAESDWLDIFRNCEEPVLLALKGQEIVGFECVSPTGGRFVSPGERIGSIGCVGVVEKQREKGIGTRLVMEGARLLKAQGCGSVELRYVYLVDWYRKMGFEVTRSLWMGEKSL